MLKGIDRLLQMPARQVQVDARSLQVGVAEQYLDRCQIGAILQQVRGKTVPQHVRTHTPVNARVLSRIIADVPDRFVGQVVTVVSRLTWK